MGLEQCPDPNDPVAMAGALYPYCASFGAALLYCILFGLLVVAHIAEGIMYRKPFCWVIAMAAAWEATGWGTRAASTLDQNGSNQTSVNLDIAQTLFVLVAPIWLNAFVYMTFGRMVLFFLPEKKIAGISARWLTLLFVLLDVTAFIVQVAGALGLSAQNASQETIDNGLHTYMAGVGVQEFFIVCFTGLTILFWRTAQHSPIYRQEKWQPLMYVMWVTILLISVRIFYRIGEYSSGFNSYPATHEWMQYVFDATPMFFAMLLLAVYHPGRVLVGPESEFPKLTKDQKKAQKVAKAQAKRDAKARLLASESGIELR